jgi:2-C-methyl-D-erythritol 4-phosphate cytidylyltransferase
VFRADLLAEAIEKAAAESFRATDDAQLVERLGVRVRVVEGRSSNLKITRPGDLAVAEAWLAEHARDL